MVLETLSSIKKDERDLNTVREIFKNLSKEHRNILYGYLQNDFDKEHPKYKGIAKGNDDGYTKYKIYPSNRDLPESS